MKTRQTNKIDLEVSKRLKQRRLELGLTQEQLANAVGVTFQQIQKYERGTNRISSSNLFALARILRTEITYFFESHDKGNLEFADAALSDTVKEQANYASITEEEKDQLRELISHFSSIKDPKLKQSIINLAKSLREAH